MKCRLCGWVEVGALQVLKCTVRVGGCVGVGVQKPVTGVILDILWKLVTACRIEVKEHSGARSALGGIL